MFIKNKTANHFRLALFFILLVVFGAICDFAPLNAASAQVNSAVANAQPLPKNIIVLLSDGTNSSVRTISRWYKGSGLAVDELIAGTVATFNTESIITDSAPGGTAYSTGFKVGDKMIAVAPEKYSLEEGKFASEWMGRPLATILEAAQSMGKSTGIVATSNIQHASPASFSAHTINRNDYNRIALQQVYNGIDVVLGGGLKYLLPENEGGTRVDNLNLVLEIKKQGYELVKTSEELAAAKAGKLWGAFAPDALAPVIDKQKLAPSEPSLSQMTSKAIANLSLNKKGFFLFVEGSQVDWGAHANDAATTIKEFLSFDDTVRIAVDFAKKNKNTAIFVVVDHNTGGMSLGSSNSDLDYSVLPLKRLLEPLKKIDGSFPWIVSQMTANISEQELRLLIKTHLGIDDLTPKEVEMLMSSKNDPRSYPILGHILSLRIPIGWTTIGHTGEDVFFGSFGPGKLTGHYQNSEIGQHLFKLLGVDLNKFNQDKFIDASKEFLKVGYQTELKINKATPSSFLVSKNNQKVEILLDTNVLKTTDGQTRQFAGLAVLNAKNSVFLPKSAMAMVKSILK